MFAFSKEQKRATLKFQLVVPTGIEPISYEPESYILSIELRDQNEIYGYKSAINFIKKLIFFQFICRTIG